MDRCDAAPGKSRPRFQKWNQPLRITQTSHAIEPAKPIDTRMTRREMEVLNYLADGLTSNEISKILKISNHTVDWYMNGIQDKLNAKNRQHVVALSFRLGLVT